jgi:hypothetical protein
MPTTDTPPVIRDHEYCALHQVQEKTLGEIEGRVQKLVNEWHGNNVALSDVRGQINLLTSRVPSDLPQQLTALALKHDALHRDFSMLRAQTYSIISAIILSGVGAFVTWVIRGGLK